MGVETFCPHTPLPRSGFGIHPSPTKRIWYSPLSREADLVFTPLPRSGFGIHTSLAKRIWYSHLSHEADLVVFL